MPINPNTASSLINAGSSLLSSAINAGSTIATNKSQQAFSNATYDKQRADALTDWNAQNFYNSPAQQMKRLHDAGLNPNLVYGNGADATSSTQPRAASAPSYNPTAPQIDLSKVGSSISDIYSLKLIQAQTDQVKQATEVAKQDAILKAAQSQNVGADTNQKGVQTDTAKFDLNLKNTLQPTTIDLAQAELDNRKAQTQSTLTNTGVAVDANARAASLNAKTLEQMTTNILKTQMETTKIPLEKQQISQAIANLKQSNEANELELKLKRLGYTFGDPVYARMAVKLAEKVHAIRSSGGTTSPVKGNAAGAAAKYLRKWQ